jgi:thioredoxin reductase (NADPH)
MKAERFSEVLIVGGGLAGLSAAIYLGRALRKVTLIDNGKSMARWEPDVQNYLGFPEGVAGPDLLRRGRDQAASYGAKFVRDEVRWARKKGDLFLLKGAQHLYSCRRLLLATGIFHIPPDIPELKACLGHSMFFCKDCDGYRVQGKNVAIYGWTNEAVEYALAMVLYSPCVFILTNRRKPRWSAANQRRISEYHIPVYQDSVTGVVHEEGNIKRIRIGKSRSIDVEALFTTRGDIYYNKLAHGLGARVDSEGEIRVDKSRQTRVRGVYAAGCVTPANCQMIIAAGEGAAAAQAINRDLFLESLRTHALRQFRRKQIRVRSVKPRIRKRPHASGEDPKAEAAFTK